MHKTIEEYEIVIEADDFKVLTNKLRLEHFEYFRDFMRLNLLIDFPGYDNKVKASVPYKDSPVKFYKWWRRHKKNVTMSFAEKVKLFLVVDKVSPTTLVKEDRQKLENKK